MHVSPGTNSTLHASRKPPVAETDLMSIAMKHLRLKAIWPATARQQRQFWKIRLAAPVLLA
jgi:hypothetical protein